MGIEKNKLYERMRRVIKKVLYPKTFSVLFLCLLFMCMLFDICQKPYWKCVGSIFLYDQGRLIAVIVLIWTFTVSFSVYCVEHFGEQYYGIRRIDILLVDLGHEGLLWLMAIIFVELFVFIVSCILEWAITLIMIAFQQFFIIIYILFIVIIKMSYKNTLIQIGKDIEVILNDNLVELVQQIREKNLNMKGSPLLFKMIQELDYLNDNNREELLCIICNVAKLLHKKSEMCKEDSTKRFQLQVDINLISYQITVYILRYRKINDIMQDFLNKLMSSAETLAFKQGILMALLENMIPEHIVMYQRLIQLEPKQYRELQIWCAVYNVFIQQYEGEEWRIAHTQFQFNELYTYQWDTKDMNIAFEAWRQIQCIYNFSFTVNIGQYKPLFKYIFPNDER